MADELWIERTARTDGSVLDASSPPAIAPQTDTVVDGCIIDHGHLEICVHGRQQLYVDAGGSVLAGYVSMRNPGRIVALRDGGFVIGPCPECDPR